MSEVINKTSSKQESVVSNVIENSNVFFLAGTAIFGFIKHFVKNEVFYIIPFVLVGVNLFFLGKLIYRLNKRELGASKKEKRRLIYQGVINLFLIGLIVTAWYYKV